MVCTTTPLALYTLTSPLKPFWMEARIQIFNHTPQCWAFWQASTHKMALATTCQIFYWQISQDIILMAIIKHPDSLDLMTLQNIWDPVLPWTFCANLNLSPRFPAYKTPSHPLSCLFYYKCFGAGIVLHNTLGTAYRATLQLRKRAEAMWRRVGQAYLCHKNSFRASFSNQFKLCGYKHDCKENIGMQSIIQWLQGKWWPICLKGQSSAIQKGSWSNLTYTTGHTTAEICKRGFIPLDYKFRTEFVN